MTPASAQALGPAEPSAVARLRAGERSPALLREALLLRGDEQEALFALARERREACFPTREVQVRSVVEISNVCRQRCNYCSIGSGERHQPYLLGAEELVRRASALHAKGRRVLLLQSGERGDDRFFDEVAHAVARVTSLHPDLHVVLCLGNATEDLYRRLREAGARGYILKFETSSPALYASWKPRDTLARRLECLDALLRLGFEVGTGNMVGLPGQTLDDLVADLTLLGSRPFAMQSTTPFIPAEGSAYEREPMGDLDTTLGFLALMRILHPARLVPTTSALEKARRGGQLAGLRAGANVVTAHDGTPEELEGRYAIYSTTRFTPREEHLARIVREAGLALPRDDR
jgi:biotin synthase